MRPRPGRSLASLASARRDGRPAIPARRLLPRPQPRAQRGAGGPLLRGGARRLSADRVREAHGDIFLRAIMPLLLYRNARYAFLEADLWRLVQEVRQESAADVHWKAVGVRASLLRTWDDWFAESEADKARHGEWLQDLTEAFVEGDRDRLLRATAHASHPAAVNRARAEADGLGDVLGRWARHVAGLVDEGKAPSEAEVDSALALCVELLPAARFAALFRRFAEQAAAWDAGAADLDAFQSVDACVSVVPMQAPVVLSEVLGLVTASPDALLKASLLDEKGVIEASLEETRFLLHALEAELRPEGDAPPAGSDQGAAGGTLRAEEDGGGGWGAAALDGDLDGDDLDGDDLVGGDPGGGDAGGGEPYLDEDGVYLAGESFAGDASFLREHDGRLSDWLSEQMSALSSRPQRLEELFLEETYLEELMEERPDERLAPIAVAHLAARRVAPTNLGDDPTHPPERSVMVENLPLMATEDDVREGLRGIGPVQEVTLFRMGEAAKHHAHVLGLRAQLAQEERNVRDLKEALRTVAIAVKRRELRGEAPSADLAAQAMDAQEPASAASAAPTAAAAAAATTTTTAGPDFEELMSAARPLGEAEETAAAATATETAEASAQGGGPAFDVASFLEAERPWSRSTMARLEEEVGLCLGRLARHASDMQVIESIADADPRAPRRPAAKGDAQRRSGQKIARQDPWCGMVYAMATLGAAEDAALVAAEPSLRLLGVAVGRRQCRVRPAADCRDLHVHLLPPFGDRLRGLAAMDLREALEAWLAPLGLELHFDAAEELRRMPGSTRGDELLRPLRVHIRCEEHRDAQMVWRTLLDMQAAAAAAAEEAPAASDGSDFFARLVPRKLGRASVDWVPPRRIQRAMRDRINKVVHADWVERSTVPAFRARR